MPLPLLPARADSNQQRGGGSHIVIGERELVLVQEEPTGDRHLHLLDGHAAKLDGNLLFKVLNRLR